MLDDELEVSVAPELEPPEDELVLDPDPPLPELLVILAPEAVVRAYEEAVRTETSEKEGARQGRQVLGGGRRGRKV